VINNLPQALTRREVESLRPPVFQKLFPVWQGFWARQAIQGRICAAMAPEKIAIFPNDFPAK
jgi:hypothetical protein